MILWRHLVSRLCAVLMEFDQPRPRVRAYAGYSHMLVAKRMFQGLANEESVWLNLALRRIVVLVVPTTPHDHPPTYHLLPLLSSFLFPKRFLFPQTTKRWKWPFPDYQGKQIRITSFFPESPGSSSPHQQNEPLRLTPLFSQTPGLPWPDYAKSPLQTISFSPEPGRPSSAHHVAQPSPSYILSS